MAREFLIVGPKDGAISVTSTAAEILPAPAGMDPQQSSIDINVISGSPVYLGPWSDTSSTKYLIKRSLGDDPASIVLATGERWYVATAAGQTATCAARRIWSSN